MKLDNSTRLLYPVRVRLLCSSMQELGNPYVLWAAPELVFLSDEEVKRRVTEHNRTCLLCQIPIDTIRPAPH